MNNKNSQEQEAQQNQSEFNQIRDELIEAEEDVASKLDLVQVAIDQRNEMIPQLFQAIQNSPKEIEALDSAINDLQIKISNAQGQEKFTLENSLDEKIKELKIMVQQYGNSEAIEKLMVQIEGSENRIAFEKKNYNESVKAYNILVKKHGSQFPEYELKSYYNEK